MSEFDMSLKRFADAVFADAESERNATIAALEARRTELFNNYEHEVLQKAYDRIQAEIQHLRSKAASHIAEASLSERRKTIALRHELEEQIFSVVLEQLDSYTKSDAYRKDMLAHAAEDAVIIGELPMILSLRSEDLPLLGPELKAALPFISVVTDDHIKIGGYLLACCERNIVIDHTLDTRLNEEKERFHKTSALVIS